MHAARNRRDSIFRLDRVFRFLRNFAPMKTKAAQIIVTVFAACLALFQNAQAVSPPPDGGYSGGNTAEGQSALLSLTTGSFNTAVGFFSLRSITTESFNTAIGAGTLLANTADENTATGAAALLSNTSGDFNTANGAFALVSNTIGSFNTANGDHALVTNTAGDSNTADGASALFSNTTGTFNTATGGSALANNTIGGNNTADGAFALFQNTTGNDNTATGEVALNANTTGAGNTAIGFHALTSNITGSGNTANGDGALTSNTAGNANTALGAGAGAAGTIGDNNVYIGAGMNGVAGESNACYIASIFGQTSASGMPVLINSNNKLGTATSSKRFKEDIKPMDKISEALLSLKPVTFRYKKEIDPARTRQLGLVAEEVEKVSPDLIVRDKGGKPYSVRYDQVNAMLLNEFLKEHRTVMELKNEIAVLTATVKEQSVQIQKVRTRLDANRFVPELAVNTP
jgi:hypothetical protein